jgi:tRNA pseudouridine65 synthase
VSGDLLPVLHRDDWLVVIDKPTGLLVHRSPVDARETRFAVQMLRNQLGRHVYPVHRLDKGTSGALAFALDPATARTMSEGFARATVGKTYLALVRAR